MNDAREAELLQQVRARDAEVKATSAELARLKDELQRAQLEIEDIKPRLDPFFKPDDKQ